VRDKPKVYRNANREWTVRRPAYGFGVASEQTYPSFNTAVRSTERLGGAMMGSAEQAHWPANGDASTPAWSVVDVEC
jgi:hypothetical protein